MLVLAKQFPFNLSDFLKNWKSSNRVSKNFPIYSSIKIHSAVLELLLA
jgi:hypothetical protein